MNIYRRPANMRKLDVNFEHGFGVEIPKIDRPSRDKIKTMKLTKIPLTF